MPHKYTTADKIRAVSIKMSTRLTEFFFLLFTDYQTDTESLVPQKHSHSGHPTRRFGPGPEGPVTRRTGKLAKRIHRTQTIAGCRVRRGRLLLGHHQRRVRSWHVVRGAQPSRRSQTARVPVARGPVLHVSRFLVRIGHPHRRPTIIHQTTDAPEAAAMQVLSAPSCSRTSRPSAPESLSFFAQVSIYILYIILYILHIIMYNMFV